MGKTFKHLPLKSTLVKSDGEKLPYMSTRHYNAGQKPQSHQTKKEFNIEDDIHSYFKGGSTFSLEPKKPNYINIENIESTKLVNSTTHIQFDKDKALPITELNGLKFESVSKKIGTTSEEITNFFKAIPDKKILEPDATIEFPFQKTKLISSPLGSQPKKTESNLDVLLPKKEVKAIKEPPTETDKLLAKFKTKKDQQQIDEKPIAIETPNEKKAKELFPEKHKENAIKLLDSYDAIKDTIKSKLTRDLIDGYIESAKSSKNDNDIKTNIGKAQDIVNYLKSASEKSKTQQPNSKPLVKDYGSNIDGVPTTALKKETKTQSVTSHYPIPSVYKPNENITSSGVIIVEKDGRVWIRQPTNHYVGYEHSFAKGGLENGLTVQQNALKELYEETGITGEITGHLVDAQGDMGKTRFYIGKRTGGDPRDAGWETQDVKLIPPKDLVKITDNKNNRVSGYLNRTRDRLIALKLERILSKKTHPITKKLM